MFVLDIVGIITFLNTNGYIYEDCLKNCYNSNTKALSVQCTCRIVLGGSFCGIIQLACEQMTLITDVLCLKNVPILLNALKITNWSIKLISFIILNTKSLSILFTLNNYYILYNFSNISREVTHILL